jgi:hypothetical protein
VTAVTHHRLPFTGYSSPLVLAFVLFLHMHPFARAALAALALQLAPRLAAAQSSPVPAYPLAPTPVLDPRVLPAGPSFSGYVSVRETRRNDSTVNAVNRARLTVMGMPYAGLAYRVQADFSAAGRLQRDSTVAATVLTDAYVQLHYAPRSSADSLSRLASLAPALVVGQFRVPFSLEYLTSFSLLKTANRSLVVDRISPRRDIGAMGQARLTRFALVMASVTNGEGANQPRNPDDRELASGRVVLRPLATLALGGKWAGSGPDHYWGYDARWMWRTLTLEGETIARSGRAPGASVTPVPARYDAGGRYALAAWRVLPWLEPELKWERFAEGTAGSTRSSESWLTPGATLRGFQDRVRFHANWIVKRTHPTARHANELVAQLVAIF